MNPELSEADLCRIEANYGETLSTLEKALIAELRLKRERADANDGAADKVVELEQEIEDLKYDVRELEELRDDLRRSEERCIELQSEVNKLEDQVRDLQMPVSC